uniref:Ig-like domain-containing protein n=1 Tax=Pygocentrus nattereri TaxID=42514 RepID=A0A3B4EPC3_PYGNA
FKSVGLRLWYNLPSNLTVKHGESLTILCLYDEKYKSNRKYWCRGYLFSSCKIVASTNTSGRTSVTDHPTQNMFTVELKSLQDSDSGHYWCCAVEITGTGSDDGDYVYLTVSSGKTSLCLIPTTILYVCIHRQKSITFIHYIYYYYFIWCD